MARTIEDLLDKIYFTSGSQAEKGSRFEKLIVAYLQTAGQYADQFSDVRLWQDWEGRQGKADTGIDIVATDRLTGELWAIQCKFYAPHHYLDKAHLDSFFTASGKAGFAKRLIVSTTDRWSSNAEAALVGQQIPVSRIGLADLLDSDIDWERRLLHPLGPMRHRGGYVAGGAWPRSVPRQWPGTSTAATRAPPADAAGHPHGGRDAHALVPARPASCQTLETSPDPWPVHIRV